MTGSTGSTALVLPARAPRRRRRRPAPPPRATAIQSIATAVPGPGFRQSELVEFMKRAHRADRRLSRLLDALYRRSGIDRRYSCLADYGRTQEAFTFYSPRADDEPPSTAKRMAAYREAAPLLAAEAALAACRAIPAFDARAITHLVVASCTGFFAPGIDVELVGDLGLAPGVARTLIGFQGCHAGLSSLRLADAICHADPRAIVLVVCVELCTLHLQLLPSEDNLLANSLFADGASAVLLRSEPLEQAAKGATPARLFVSRCASWLEPDSRAEMAWLVGDQGFEMRLSSLVPRFLGANIESFFAEALGMDGDAVAALDFWAVHPGGPAILDEIQRSLALDPRLLAPSRSVLRDFGNMSSPTVLFVLDRIWQARGRGSEGTGTGAPERGVALAFGPGLTLEAILLEMRP